MAKDKKVPEIRFEEFNSKNKYGWEQCKLEDVAHINPKSQLPEEFEYVDLESVVGISLVSHRTENRDSAPSRAQRIAKLGDIFYQTVRPYQKNNYLYDLPYDNYVFSTGYAQLRPHGDSYFLLSRLQEEHFVSNVLERSTGTSYPSINSTDLAQIELTIPKGNEEQKRIGNLFKSLDSTITLHQHKYAKTVNIKKAMLEKMFPTQGTNIPEIRYTKYRELYEAKDGESNMKNPYVWENRTLEDIFNILDGDRGSNYPSENDFFESGATLFLDTGNVKKNGFNFLKRKYITKEKDESLRSGKLELHDFILTSRGTLGNVAYYDEKMWNDYPSIRINSAMLILRPVLFKEISNEFLESVLRGKVIDTFMLRNHVGSAQPHITKRDFSKVEIKSPIKIEEQQKVGEFFKQLDELISLYQLELTKLKNIKKSLLENMFVQEEANQ